MAGGKKTYCEVLPGKTQYEHVTSVWTSQPSRIVKGSEAIEVELFAEFEDGFELKCFRAGTGTNPDEAVDLPGTKVTLSTQSLFVFAVPKTKDISVKGVSISPEGEVSLLVGDTVDLNASVTPADATNKNVTWSVSDGNVVDLSSTADPAVKVTGLTTGSATVTVTTQDGGHTASRSVTVNLHGAPDLTFRKKTLCVGEAFTLGAKDGKLAFDSFAVTSGTGVVTLSPTSGGTTTTVTAGQTAGTATVVAKKEGYEDASCEICVWEPTLTLNPDTVGVGDSTTASVGSSGADGVSGYAYRWTMDAAADGYLSWKNDDKASMVFTCIADASGKMKLGGSVTVLVPKGSEGTLPTLTFTITVSRNTTMARLKEEVAKGIADQKPMMVDANIAYGSVVGAVASAVVCSASCTAYSFTACLASLTVSGVDIARKICSGTAAGPYKVAGALDDKIHASHARATVAAASAAVGKNALAALEKATASFEHAGKKIFVKL